MRITKSGVDVIVIDDTHFEDGISTPSGKVHLIKFKFENPTEQKVDWAIKTFPDTNRFIIDDNIRIYNGILKNTNKKYYIQNVVGVPFVSFLRKNNKVLLDFTRLSDFERQFCLNVVLEDLLRNVEVVLMSRTDYESNLETLNAWNGNTIIEDRSYTI